MMFEWEVKKAHQEQEEKRLTHHKKQKEHLYKQSKREKAMQTFCMWLKMSLDKQQDEMKIK